MRLVKILVILFIPIGATAQSSRSLCDENIEYLRLDLISMLNKTVAMPPIAQVYRAARGRYDELLIMQNRGEYYSCVSESERVLRITKPYGNR